jgi:hypothetical protein
MALVSGSNWLQKLQAEESGNPYEEEYPTTKWDTVPTLTPEANVCPACDCTATIQSVNVIIQQLQKFSEYQETTLGNIITQLESRIYAEGGGSPRFGRGTAVGGVAAVYGEDKAVSDFWLGLQQIENMFMTRSPQPTDTQMLQSQLQNIDRFAAAYTIDSAKVATWKQKLNKWISASVTSGGKTVYFAPNIKTFGSGL